MTNEQVAQIVSLIEAVWVRDRPDEWRVVMAIGLAPLPFDPVRAALGDLINGSVHPPTPAEIRLAVAKRQGAVAPDATGVLGEEWANRARDAMYRNDYDNFPRAPHPAISEGVAAFGGVEAVMDDRIGWRKFWSSWRQDAIATAMTDEAILQAHTTALTSGRNGELEA